MKKLLGSIVLIIAITTFFNSAQAQIAINNLGQVYTQNFDSLGTNGVNWTNEVTISGWLFVQSTNSVDAGPITTLTASEGGIIFSFEGFPLNTGTSGANDRSLGSAAGLTFFPPPTNDFFYGARFVNSTGNTITNMNVAYIGEQWRDQSATSQTIQFFHRVGGTNFLGDPSNVGWTATPSLDFTSLQNANSGTLNGNNPANKTNIVNDIPVTVAAGQEFWIRWADLDNVGVSDQFLSIDDVTLTFTGINTNTNTPASNDVLAVTAEFKKPKSKLRFKGTKGFGLKIYLRSTNTLTKASYAAFGGNGTNTPTNLVFVEAGKFIAAKGKLAKQKGVNIVVKSKKNKVGVGITAGSSPVTLVLKVDGTQETNAVSALITNVFTDVKVK